MGNSKVKAWWDAFSVEGLYSEGKYQGDAAGEHEAAAAVHRAKATNNLMELVAAVDDFIRFFCGFHSIKARCLTNAVHFQFEVDRDALISKELPQPSECDMPSEDVRGIFDQSKVAAGELLLRAVVETDDGSLIANAFSAGKPMGLLQKLPVYAQFVMVLTNAVEAVWYEQAIPNCKLSLNVYASLLVDGAPVLEMLDGVSSVEVMEMTKGVERGGVREWVTQIRDRGIEVLLDDFDSRHPGAGSSCDGVKICVFANAFHTLQAVNEDGGPQDVEVVKKEKLNDMDFRDYHCSLVPTVQPCISKMVFEGSENCMKSTVSPGPPLTFDNAQATTASVHVYQTAAKIQGLQNPGLQMVHQGGRALYDDEEFDDDVLALLRNLGKDPSGSARKGDAGTMAWMGSEATRRANMKTRPLVCGVTKTSKASATPLAAEPVICTTPATVTPAMSQATTPAPATCAAPAPVTEVLQPAAVMYAAPVAYAAAAPITEVAQLRTVTYAAPVTYAA